MSESKIKSLGEVSRIAAGLRAKGKKIVFTNGCFDLLHYGHVKYLKQAKQKGDILIVGVNSDSSLRMIKGRGRPLVKEKNRIGVIAGLESVDFVILFKETDPLKVIEAVKPDILVKGADWRKADIVGARFVSGYGGRVCRVALLKNESTSGLISKIVSNFSAKKH